MMCGEKWRRVRGKVEGQIKKWGYEIISRNPEKPGNLKWGYKYFQYPDEKVTKEDNKQIAISIQHS